MRDTVVLTLSAAPNMVPQFNKTLSGDNRMASPPLFDIEATIKSFGRYAGPPSADHVTDFLGTRTRTCYVQGLQGGTVEDYPIPTNFHATALEWAGVLAAVDEAADPLIAVELGAGWAPWLVSVACAARQRGLKNVRLVGVEGSKKHCDFMHWHFRDNGLDPADHTLLHGVVGPSDGTAEFPLLADPSVDWGTPAILSMPAAGGPAQLRRLAAAVAQRLRWFRRSAQAVSTERLPCYSIDTLLAPLGMVDLVHIDIQGHEHVVMAAGQQALKQKVRRVVVGTHGRAIEQQLLDEMSAAGWLLEAEETCLYRQTSGCMALVRDGCQIWRNPNLASRAAETAPRAAA